MEVSVSTVIAVSPLPLREDVPPEEVRVAAVEAEAARDPWEREEKKLNLHLAVTQLIVTQKINSNML